MDTGQQLLTLKRDLTDECDTKRLDTSVIHLKVTGRTKHYMGRFVASARVTRNDDVGVAAGRVPEKSKSLASERVALLLLKIGVRGSSEFETCFLGRHERIRQANPSSVLYSAPKAQIRKCKYGKSWGRANVPTSDAAAKKRERVPSLALQLSPRRRERASCLAWRAREGKS